MSELESDPTVPKSVTSELERLREEKTILRATLRIVLNCLGRENVLYPGLSAEILRALEETR